jgi:hypothetical protein
MNGSAYIDTILRFVSPRVTHLELSVFYRILFSRLLDLIYFCFTNFKF